MDVNYLLYSVVAFSLTVVLGIIAFATYLSIVRRKYAHMPCPKMDNFFLGHLPSVMKYGDNGGIFFHLAAKWYKECGPIFVFYLIGTPVVVTINPDDVKKLLNNKCIKKSPILYSRFATVLGARYTNESLMSVEGEIWEKFRTHYNPAFKKSHLADYLPLINQSVQDSIKRIKVHADNGTLLDMKSELHLVTMSSISKMVFSKDLTSATWTSQELGLTRKTKNEWRLNELLYFASDGSLKTLTNPFYTYTNQTAVRDYHEAARAVRKIMIDLLQERLTALEQGQEFPEDLLSYILSLLHVDPSVTTDTLLDNIIFFISGGYQNTSSLLSSILLEILDKPAILNRLVQEINDVMGKRSEVTNEDLQKFVYMNQVMKETLRIHPPLVGVMREAPPGYSLSGYDIPHNTAVMMSNYLACRLEQNFTDPLTFNPDRFAPNQEERPDVHVYFPFGSGPRYCIGKHMAIIEVKTILAGLLKHFTFHLSEVPDNIELVFHGLIAEPTNDLHCSVSYQK